MHIPKYQKEEQFAADLLKLRDKLTPRHCQDLDLQWITPQETLYQMQSGTERGKEGRTWKESDLP